MGRLDEEQQAIQDELAAWEDMDFERHRNDNEADEKKRTARGKKARPLSEFWGAK